MTHQLNFALGLSKLNIKPIKQVPPPNKLVRHVGTMSVDSANSTCRLCISSSFDTSSKTYNTGSSTVILSTSSPAIPSAVFSTKSIWSPTFSGVNPKRIASGPLIIVLSAPVSITNSISWPIRQRIRELSQLSPVYCYPDDNDRSIWPVRGAFPDQGLGSSRGVIKTLSPHFQDSRGEIIINVTWRFRFRRRFNLTVYCTIKSRTLADNLAS